MRNIRRTSNFKFQVVITKNKKTLRSSRFSILESALAWRDVVQAQIDSNEDVVLFETVRGYGIWTIPLRHVELIEQKRGERVKEKLIGRVKGLLGMSEPEVDTSDLELRYD